MREVLYRVLLSTRCWPLLISSLVCQFDTCMVYGYTAPRLVVYRMTRLDDQQWHPLELWLHMDFRCADFHTHNDLRLKSLSALGLSVSNFSSCPHAKPSHHQHTPMSKANGNVAIDVDAAIDSLPHDQAVAVRNLLQQQEQEHAAQLERERIQHAEELERQRRSEVRVDVVDLSAYPADGPSLGVHGPPNANYVAQPVTPKGSNNDDGCQDFWAVCCCCIFCGPIGVCCYLLCCRDDKK